MAFPTVQTTNTSSETSNATTHTVNLPTGINSGDLLILQFGVDGDPAVTLAGWTSFLVVTYGSSGRSKMEVFWREADGTEASTESVTTDISERSAHNTYRITGMDDPDTQPPEASTGATIGTADTSADHDSLTPTGGAEDFLWLAVGVADNGAGLSDANTAPTSYTNLLNVNSGSSGGVGAFSSRRDLNAASEDPAATGLTVNSRWIAATVAIHPAPTDTISAQHLVSQFTGYTHAVVTADQTVVVPHLP